jgi:hypothetical protein
MSKKSPTSEPPRLSPDAPVLKAINEIAKILGPYDRTEQLKALAQACVQMGMYDHAQQFLTELQRGD